MNPPTEHISEDDLLGVIVEPDIFGLAVSLDAVKTAADSAGIGSHVVKELSYQSAFSRGVKELKKHRAIDRLETKANGKVHFQFTNKHEDEDSIAYTYETTVKLDPETGAIECSDDVIRDNVTELVREAMGTRTTSDVTNLIKKLLADHADFYATSRKGGSYFVPIEHISYVRQLETFVDAIGSYKDKLRVFPVPKGTSEGNRNVRDAVSSTIVDLIDEINETVDGFSDTTKDSTIKNAQERFDTVSYKIGCVEQYLMGTAGDLRDTLKTAKERLAQKVLGLNPEEPQEAAEPTVAELIAELEQ